jgi:hypothetical protein
VRRLTAAINLCFDTQLLLIFVNAICGCSDGIWVMGEILWVFFVYEKMIGKL